MSLSAKDQEIIAGQFTGDPIIEHIIKVVADRNFIKPADIIGRSRKPPVVEARFDAIAEVYGKCRDLSLTDIGIAFGHRSYAAIRNALEQRDLDVPVSGIIDRVAVVADAKNGLSVADLAHKHHCSRPSIRKILYGAKITFKP